MLPFFFCLLAVGWVVVVLFFFFYSVLVRYIAFSAVRSMYLNNLWFHLVLRDTGQVFMSFCCDAYGYGFLYSHHD